MTCIGRIHLREQIAEATHGHSIYEARHDEYRTDEEVPFLVSDEPFELSPEQAVELQELGEIVYSYMDATVDLYERDERVRALLDTGKPELFHGLSDARYLFYRPDIIFTDVGFQIVEVETSPFGLGLASILDEAYRGEGHDTLESGISLEDQVRSHTGDTGTVVYTDKTDQYAGQLSYLADRVFSDDESRRWTAEHVADSPGDGSQETYRGFYLSERETDSAVERLVNTLLESASETASPSLTPAFEEKAILGLIFDERWQQYFVDKLGEQAVDKLQKWIPETIIIGEEDHFIGKLPSGNNGLDELSKLSRKKRGYALKTSGYDTDASWAEGVSFLHELSASRTQDVVDAARDRDGLMILQKFQSGTKQVPMGFSNLKGEKDTMEGRVRLTPYFAAAGEAAGRLIVAKATLVAGTDRIHAGTNTINTAVSRAN